MVVDKDVTVKKLLKILLPVYDLVELFILVYPEQPPPIKRTRLNVEGEKLIKKIYMTDDLEKRTRLLGEAWEKYFSINWMYHVYGCMLAANDLSASDGVPWEKMGTIPTPKSATRCESP